MDKRFKTMPIIDKYDWEVMVAEEAGYTKYIDKKEGFFDAPIFCRDKGFSYLDISYFLDCAFCTDGENGSYRNITKDSFNPNFNDRNFNKKANEIRKEIAKAAIRLFDKGIAPEKFVVEIYW